MGLPHGGNTGKECSILSYSVRKEPMATWSRIDLCRLQMLLAYVLYLRRPSLATTSSSVSESRKSPLSHGYLNHVHQPLGIACSQIAHWSMDAKHSTTV
jgi:hypothetical protein